MAKIHTDTHIKARETVMQTYSGAFYVSVTSCGWVNPPQERISPKPEDATCLKCLELLKS
jgi:hypothetical protein